MQLTSCLLCLWFKICWACIELIALRSNTACLSVLFHDPCVLKSRLSHTADFYKPIATDKFIFFFLQKTKHFSQRCVFFFAKLGLAFSWRTGDLWSSKWNFCQHMTKALNFKSDAEHFFITKTTVAGIWVYCFLTTSSKKALCPLLYHWGHQLIRPPTLFFLNWFCGDKR